MQQPFLSADDAELLRRRNIAFDRHILLFRLWVLEAHLKLDVVQVVQISEVASLVLVEISSCSFVHSEVALLNLCSGHDEAFERLKPPVSEDNTYF